VHLKTFHPRGPGDSSLKLKAIWYDPRYGISYLLHQADNAGIQTYTPPTNGRGNDWILLLEDAAANYPLPGVPR
jgi:hypothetical protein